MTTRDHLLDLVNVATGGHLDHLAMKHFGLMRSEQPPENDYELRRRCGETHPQTLGGPPALVGGFIAEGHGNLSAAVERQLKRGMLEGVDLRTTRDAVVSAIEGVDGVIKATLAEDEAKPWIVIVDLTVGADFDLPTVLAEVRRVAEDATAVGVVVEIPLEAVAKPAPVAAGPTLVAEYVQELEAKNENLEREIKQTISHWSRCQGELEGAQRDLRRTLDVKYKLEAEVANLRTEVETLIQAMPDDPVATRDGLRRALPMIDRFRSQHAKGPHHDSASKIHEVPEFKFHRGPVIRCQGEED